MLFTTVFVQWGVICKICPFQRKRWVLMPCSKYRTKNNRKSEVTQLCPILCDPMDCSLPGSSIHGILQSRILEWVDLPSSRGSPQFRNQTYNSCVSCIADRFFTHWVTWEAPNCMFLTILLISDFNKNFSFWKMKSGGLSWGKYYKGNKTGLETLTRTRFG